MITYMINVIGIGDTRHRLTFKACTTYHEELSWGNMAKREKRE